MKVTTLNFWCGVFVGAGFVKFGPSIVKGFKEGFKKGLGLTSPSEEVKKFGEVACNAAQSYSPDDANAGGTSDSSGSETSDESVSEIQEIYEKLAAGYGGNPPELKTIISDDGTSYIIFPANNADAIDASQITAGTLISKKTNDDSDDEFSELDS